MKNAKMNFMHDTTEEDYQPFDWVGGTRLLPEAYLKQGSGESAGTKNIYTTNAIEYDNLKSLETCQYSHVGQNNSRIDERYGHHNFLQTRGSKLHYQNHGTNLFGERLSNSTSSVTPHEREKHSSTPPYETMLRSTKGDGEFNEMNVPPQVGNKVHQSLNFSLSDQSKQFLVQLSKEENHKDTSVNISAESSDTKITMDNLNEELQSKVTHKAVDSYSKKVIGKKPSAKQCNNCKVVCSILTRHDFRGKPLCNACGLYFRKYLKHRSEKMIQRAEKRRLKKLEAEKNTWKIKFIE
eukprot:Awhi_evm1s9195